MPTAKAIVTRGSRGLGRNTVLSLAKKGVHSIFTYNSNRAEADKVVVAVREAGAKAVALQLDTGDVRSFDAFVRNVRSALAGFGMERFDYLVNNAGTAHHNSIEKTTEEELDKLYTVHFKGVFFLTQKLLSLIKHGGRIINVSSGLTRITIPESGRYASMNGAVEVLTRYLAKELGARGIVVNTVAPGAIAPDFSGGMVRDNPEISKRCRDGGAGPRWPTRRHRSDDRLTAFRGQPLRQRPAHRSLWRNGALELTGGQNSGRW
jgi:NAD(P)-dependent dehydrogenase (short-subunit alcohol dehydrogenase family)